MTKSAQKKYSLLVPTSMGVRLTPVDSQPYHSSDTFKMQATSAESNVASVASYLGLPVKVLTAFVKDSPVSHFIKNNIRSRRMDFEGPEFEQDNPWGYWGKATTLRTDTHRLVLHTDGTTELYDHTTPEKETHNVANENPKIVNVLKANLKKRLDR